MPSQLNDPCAPSLFSTQRYYLGSVLGLAAVFVGALLLGFFLIRGTVSWFDVGQVLVVGGPVGVLLGLYEVYVFPHLLTRRPLWLRFLVGVALRLLAFGLLLWIGRAVTAAQLREAAHSATFRALLQGELQELRLLDPAHTTLTKTMVSRGLVLYVVLVLGISSLYQTGRKIGLRALGRLMLGYYNQPVEEKRLFLFVDLKDSTTLAEQLGNLRYSAFIRDFFLDMGAPIAATRGEVYQYVGDEVVVTWEWPAGLKQARCLRCFFAMQQAVERRRAYYLREYGVVPTFKAGLHGGLVVATQVGDIKTDLVFHGDVLNTTARIQAQCNALQSRLLVSATVLEALGPQLPYQVRPLGAFTLRGKNQLVDLFDVQPIQVEVLSTSDFPR